MPFVNPAMVSGPAGPDAVLPPGDAVAVYDVIAEPFAFGAVKLIVAWPSAASADTLAGGSGAPAGVTDPDAVEAAPVPPEFVAVTVNV